MIWLRAGAGLQARMTRGQRRVLVFLGLVALGCLLLGFLTGYLHSSAGKGSEHVVQLPSLIPHDVAVQRALPLLEEYQHWGHYTRSASDVSGDTDLSLSFSLVGVQQSELAGERDPYHLGQTVALLLYIEDGPIALERLASVPDTNSVIRIRAGQLLFDQVSVEDVTFDSITLTGQLTSTDPAPITDESKTWRLSIFDTP